MQTDYRSLRAQLPAEFRKPSPRRFLMMGALWGLAGTSIYGIVVMDFPWFANLALSLIIGHCFGVGGLLGHELMHGSITRNKNLQNFLGFFEFLPFLITPTFWRYWHNNLHHTHTQRAILDPDAYPTKRLFSQSRFAQWMFPFSPGSGHKRSYSYLFFWFSVNTLVAQLYFRFRNSAYKKLNHRAVTTELVTAASIHICFLYWAGPSNWLWVSVIPFFIQNYIPFSYISTNHNLSPLTKSNDPLVNSLTVTNHPVLEFLHLNFGYHVEHHLFPTMCHSHHKKLHHILKEKYPETYQYMPKFDAIKKLYQTARIYKNNHTLMHPHTEETFPTLGLQPSKSIGGTSIVTERTTITAAPMSGPPPM